MDASAVCPHISHRWISRDGWLVVWAVLFLGAGALSRLDASGETWYGGLFFPVIFFSPIVLRIAEDVASHVMARIIGSEDDEQPAPFWRRLLGDGLMGLAVGVIISLLWFGVQLATTPASGDPTPYAQIALFAAPFGLAVLVTTMTGTVVGWLAQRRSDADRRVSQVFVAVTLMIVGEAVFVGLYYALTAIQSALAGA